MTATTAIWIRNDLRLQDHPAIERALLISGKPDDRILFVFHVHERYFKKDNPRVDYFYKTVRSFSDDLAAKGIGIRFIYGSAEDAWHDFFDQFPDVTAVVATMDPTDFALERDALVKELTVARDVHFELTESNHIHHQHAIYKDDNTPYKVYTPYMKQWMKRSVRPLIAIDHAKLSEKSLNVAMNRDTLDQQLAHSRWDWKAIGEKNAHKRMTQFMEERLHAYDEQRDYPAIAGTSRLSPYLKTGTLSAVQVYHAAYAALENGSKGAETYIKELAWRDFYNMIHSHYDDLKHQEFQEKFRHLDWRNDPELLERWKQGQTGFPLIDAAMRQLNQTGWMHNRLRMAVASFLTKDYHLDWREGEQYFAERLIDYDEASNVGGWQWASSVGTDASPYFRVFNPVRQSKRFDPKGSFIKKYVPELSNVPEKYIHEPAKISGKAKEESGFEIGVDYPNPSVDHSEARLKAIAMFEGGSSS
ncbi:cryptochrome/photolyase family protein [Salisediminibacterium beveridgei]|uniref:Deoxyribodipyrimidine photo-lyase n=1 Tax=Salisediminibacterium beveridgei TaxID=632773 RepID=A0A1D7QXF8_9BACI|nr:deoxyribodipyrimidine photo-lyase [Salisediminibacterium beveridgei]AOM83696.1 Deoxyribodipyrimidine photolyase [Salisediminibacterium beveridgei]